MLILSPTVPAISVAGSHGQQGFSVTSTDDNDPGDAQSNAVNKNNQTPTGGSDAEDKVSGRSLKNRILDFTSSTTGIISGASALLVALAVLIGAVTGLWSKLVQTPSSGSTPKVTQSSSRPLSCPTGLPSWYKQPKTLERPQGVPLVICPVDVNDGRPLSRSLSLSGLILGSAPPGEHLELVSYPDPNTCDVYGNPGTGGYFGLQEIDPSDNNGGWQFTTPKSYPGSETIRRFIYFVLGSESALQSLTADRLKWTQTHRSGTYPGMATLPPDLTELAYITVQAPVPHGLHCRRP